MTVSTLSSAVSYAGNGATVAFAIPFYWIENSHIVVELYNPVGPVTTSWALGVNYSLTGVGNMGGGTLTATVAPASGLTLRIMRVVPILQLSDYISHDTFAAETAERDYDYLTMICQQLSQSIGDLGSGYAVSFANVGASGASSYAGSSGSVHQFKKIAGAGGVTVSETATQITVSGSGAGIDLAADYVWTGQHTHSKVAARTVPSWVIKSLQGGVEIVDSSILLGSDYSTAMDVRKNTDVSVEAPVDGSWGGNFGIYLQHKASGTTGAFGTLTGGIRSQMETTQVHGAGPVNDSAAAYFSIYNNGSDVGGFGAHVDAYHVGTAGAYGHTTYGMSVEFYKQIAGGVTAGLTLRSLGNYSMNFGLIIAHAPPGDAYMDRGIQFGSPTYANGGLAGSEGYRTNFYVGIDMSWGSYVGGAAISIPDGAVVVWSDYAKQQSLGPYKTCETAFYSGTGNWVIANNGSNRVQFNMTTSNIFQFANEAISLWNPGTLWALSMDASKAYTTANAGALVANTGATNITSGMIKGYIRCKVGGVFVKIPYFAD